MKTVNIVLVIFLMLSIILPFSSFGQVPSYVPSADLKGYWSFNGDASDQSIYAWDGTLFGPVLANDRHGAPDSAYLFNGTSDYIMIGDPTPAHLQIQDSITLSAWIYIASYPGASNLGEIVGTQCDICPYAGATIFIDGRTNSDGQPCPPGHIHFQIGDGTSYHVTNTQTTVPLNEWVLITATRKANENAKVYYNGVLQPSNSVSWNGAVSYTNTYFAIGREKDYANRFFNGYIDEVGIWNRALTQCEVIAMYKEDIPDTIIYDSACISYTAPDNTVYTSSGIYTAIIPNYLGCDSIIEINLTIWDAFAIIENDTIADGDSLLWQGSYYSQTGTSTKEFTTIHGCDSTYTLNLVREFSPGQLCDWQYYSTISVNNTANPETLTDYSVLAIVNTAQLIIDGKVNADGSDFRFSTDGTNDLEYWIEPGIQNEHGMNDDSTHIWVKIPVIPAAGSVVVFIFYGNPVATAKSNIGSTFLFGDDFDDNTINTTLWDEILNNSGQMTEQNQRIEHSSPTSSPESGSALFSKQSFTGPVVVDMQFKKGGYVYRGAGLMDDYSTNQNSAWIGWQDWGAFGPGVTIAGSSTGSAFRSDTWSRTYNPEYYLTVYRNPDSTFRFIAHIPSFEVDGYKYWEQSFTTEKMPLDQPLKVGSSEYVWQYASPLWIRYEDNIRVRKYSEPEPIISLLDEYETHVPDSVEFDTICSNESLLWRGNNYSVAGTYYDSLITQFGCDSVFVLELFTWTAPVISCTSDTICNGNFATIEASGAISYLWNTASTDNPYNVNPGTTTIYSVTGTDVNMCSGSAQATVLVYDLPINLYDMIPTKINEFTADANTIVLDHFNNSSTGDLYSSLSYVPSFCNLNEAAIIPANNFIHYSYSANLRDAATVDFWAKIDQYPTQLVNFNWIFSTTPPGSGHVFHLDVNSSGILTMSNWPGTGLGTLSSNEVIPLNEWTRITVAWGDTTQIYINGVLDTANTGSFRPSASGAYHIYVPKWGNDSAMVIDELQISNCKRSRAAIQSVNEYMSVYASDADICPNTSSDIMIVNPESGIEYQLLMDGSPQGAPQTGACDTLVFNTGLLSTGAIFTFTAVNLLTGCNILLDTAISININPVYNFADTAEICNGNDYYWHGNYYSTTGVYNDNLLSIEGCDSIWTLNLTVNPTYYTQADISICDGDSYLWRGNYYSVANMYYDSLLSSLGCDSVFALNLNVNPTYFTQTDISICDGDSYLWRGNYYSVANMYYDSLLSSLGCDSVFALNLSVNPGFYSVEYDSICSGDSIYWRSNYYSTAGMHYDSLHTIFGCDSVYTLNLLLHPSYIDLTDTTVCNGTIMNWRSGEYENTGTYYDSLQTINGCDSIFVLNLTVNPTFEDLINDSICFGDSVFWRSNYYSSTGTYYDSFTNIYGCDSSYVLDLYVFPSTDAQIISPDTFYCLYNDPVTVSAVPSGGIFSGSGISGSTFDPSLAGLGFWPVSYMYTDSNGCLSYDTVWVLVDACTSVGEITDGRFIIYPNPAKNECSIILKETTDELIFQLFTVNGSMILEETHRNTSSVLLNTGNLSAGSYIIRVITQEYSNQKILIIE
ncbi:MAG: hypothetical protein C0592_06230 [Marinilabiliales bacterium]|nr:MAG: hypothetical protein C0592_06230 [Marinilabiliales bacterium]